MFDHFKDAEVIVIAPNFDKDGKLTDIIKLFPDSKIKITYTHDASPLQRMISSTMNLNDKDHICRIDGIRPFFDIESITTMLETASAGKYDCVKFPDDFPQWFTSDIYKVSALRRLSAIFENEVIQNKAALCVHPKFFMMRDARFKTTYLNKLPSYSDEYLMKCKSMLSDLNAGGRMDVNNKNIPAGDQLTFHYMLATKYIDKSDHVLDIASGMGYGSRILSKYARRIIGADCDLETIELAKKTSLSFENIDFSIEDVTSMSFDSESFDKVVSMETIEHVDVKKYCEEIYRVLKPGGLLILSTPQSSYGKIPVVPEHLIEFSLEELKDIINKHFKIEEIIGIKAGTIYFPEDPIGTSTFLVAKKPY